MTSINTIFNPDAEIIKLIETAEKNVVEIVIINHNEEVTSVLTWDFNENIERRMFQMKKHNEDQVGQYIVKGMNYKMNYYIDQYYLTDLLTNLPIM